MSPILPRLSLALAAAAIAAGCSSGVPLDDTNANATPSHTAQTGSYTQSGVQGVDLTSAGTAADGGPGGGIGRIIYFDFDSFAIRTDAQPTIDAHARFVKAEQGRKVVIEGHTDERGGREYNLALGQKRAEAVRRSLALLGVNDQQMEAVSFGEEKPAASGHSEAAHSKNRRAELSYR